MLDNKEKQDFKVWLDSFAKKYNSGNDKSYIPEDMDEFLTDWEKNHKEIHEILGGITKTIELDLDDEIKPLGLTQLSNTIKPALDIMKGYFEKYQLNLAHLAYPTLPICNKINTTKHICGYAERLKLDDDKKKIIKDATAKLGELYKRNRIENNKSRITITTHPKAFALLGSYKFEGKLYSCFKQGKFNSDKKYTLCNGQNTYVLLGHRNKSFGELDDVNEEITSRAVGAIQGDIFNVFNSKNGDFDKSLMMKSLGETLLGKKDTQVFNETIKLNGGINYVGSYITSVFPKESQYKTINLQFSTKYSKEFHQDKYSTLALRREGWVRDYDSYANWE